MIFIVDLEPRKGALRDQVLPPMSDVKTINATGQTVFLDPILTVQTPYRSRRFVHVNNSAMGWPMSVMGTGRSPSYRFLR